MTVSNMTAETFMDFWFRWMALYGICQANYMVDRTLIIISDTDNMFPVQKRVYYKLYVWWLSIHEIHTIT